MCLLFNILDFVSSAYPILLWWSRECVFYFVIIIKSEEWTINHCLGLGRATMCCTFNCVFILLNTCFCNGYFHILGIMVTTPYLTSLKTWFILQIWPCNHFKRSVVTKIIHRTVRMPHISRHHSNVYVILVNRECFARSKHKKSNGANKLSLVAPPHDRVIPWSPCCVIRCIQIEYLAMRDCNIRQGLWQIYDYLIYDISPKPSS